VVNADNVTSLDLAGIVAAHRATAAAMTLAVHDEPFLMPFGEITVDGDRVTDYVEKPTYRICISSAVTVLGPPAVALVEPGEDVGLPVLARRVLDAGMVLSAHHHEADWADVNDLGVERAGRVVARIRTSSPGPLVSRRILVTGPGVPGALRVRTGCGRRRASVTGWGVHPRRPRLHP
jgi:NDP-sugar pyrophosphorylase family protein